MRNDQTQHGDFDGKEVITLYDTTSVGDVITCLRKIRGRTTAQTGSEEDAPAQFINPKTHHILPGMLCLGSGCMWELSPPAARVCCEPETVPQR